MSMDTADELSSSESLLNHSERDLNIQNLQKSAQKDRNRLSSMLERYRNGSEASLGGEEDEVESNADDYIVHKRHSGINQFSTSSSASFKTVDEPPVLKQEPQEPQFNFEPVPTITSTHYESDESTPASYHSAKNDSTLLTVGNRQSVLSDYAASIHEVNKVEYVDDRIDYEVNKENTFDSDSATKRPAVVKVSRTSSRRGRSRGNSKSTITVNQKSPSHVQKISLDSNEGTEYSATSSKYASSGVSGKDTQYAQQSLSQSQLNTPSPKQIPEDEFPKVDEERKGSIDSFNFDIGPLQTKKEDGVPQSSERLTTTSLDSSIPSRSPDRPINPASVRYPLGKIKNEASHNRETQSVDIGGLDNLMVQLDDEISKSPIMKRRSLSPNHQDTINQSFNDEIDEVESSSSKKNPRPLPPPPLPKHDTQRSSSGIEIPMNQNTAQEDGFVTEDEEEVQQENEAQTSKQLRKPKSHKKRSSKEKRKSRASSTFQKGHFNHDTLVNLLQVTEGTIIGEEFQNIGLEPHEKQLVERLVDSLSRLTADMIIDSERHDESVKRLNKAIKALEGF